MLRTKELQYETALAEKRFGSRHYSIKMNGQEIYAENLPTNGRMADYAKSVQEKVEILRKILPKADWNATIEQQWKEEFSRFEILNLRDMSLIQVNV